MAKSKVLIVGGTGYLGKRLVRASLSQGHETYILHRPEMGVDIEKIQMLLSFKQQGARLVPGSFSDHQSLVDAVKLVDVVICAISGVHIRSHEILMQLKLVDVIKEAGNVKRMTAIYVDEDDIAVYTMKTIDDSRTLNKTLYLRPPLNILSQREVVQIWEELTAKQLHKSSMSREEFLAPFKGYSYAQQVGLTHYYHVLYGGSLANFDIGDDAAEASELYPQIKYTSVHEYLKRYL